MKISKLFHWLYAILMFLPLIVFIPNAFYYGFNHEAVSQEKTEQIPVYYQSNEVNTINDLYIGNIYFYTDNFNKIVSGNYNLLSIDVDLAKEQIPFLSNTTIDSYLYIQARSDNKLYLNYLSNGNARFDFIGNISFNFIVVDKFNINYLEEYLLPYITETNFNYVKEYLPLTTNMSITDSMSYAWISTWQNDLFSWSYDSFLTQPFLYITNLFNVPATNTLLYCLSYWLNISIIWLVFDVVVYVPLLVHRWLDKGIIE